MVTFAASLIGAAAVFARITSAAPQYGYGDMRYDYISSSRVGERLKIFVVNTALLLPLP